MSDYMLPYEVRQNGLAGWPENVVQRAPMLRMGIPVMADKWDQFALMGRMFNIHETTIGTPINGGAIDAAGIVLTAPWVRFTVPTGTTIFPRHLNVTLQAAAGTLTEMALVYTNTDTFTSGGTAITVLNWRTDAPRASAVTNAFIGPTGGANVEGALSSPRAIYQFTFPLAFGANENALMAVDQWWDQLIPIIGPASVCLFLGAAGTTPSALYSFDWAEVATTNIKE